MFVFLSATKVLLPNLFLTIRLRTISSTFTGFKCYIRTINDRRLLLLLQGGSVSCQHNLVNPLKIGENTQTVSFSAESFRGMEKLVSEIFIQLLLLAGSYAQFQICTSAHVHRNLLTHNMEENSLYAKDDGFDALLLFHISYMNNTAILFFLCLHITLQYMQIPP